jgi:hypothetical protein
MNKITYLDFEEILGFEIDNKVKDMISNFDLSYRVLDKNERDNYLLNVVDVLTSEITKSGEHRISEWENGWFENLDEFRKTKNIENLIPKYHGKNRIVRWKGDVVMPLTENFDYKIHICFVDAIVRHYLKNVDNIFEFGCGPAYHLVRLNEYDNSIKLNGTDWTVSSQNIINEINNILDLEIGAYNLNFFNPDYSIEIPENTGIYTVAALEQVGDDFKKFVSFLIEKNPKICVHLEPIDELLDEEQLIDNLSIRYFRKRNYLNKFLPYLENLEKEGKIEILKKQRIFSGSYFIEGHSLIVWKNK